jgi:hypothetical protein
VAVAHRADHERVGSPSVARLRAYLRGGATAASFARGTRLAVGAVVCAVPAYFAFRFLFNAEGPGAMACVLGVVLFGGPAVVILPALRHDPDHAGREEVVRRRLERELSTPAAAKDGSGVPTSTWAQRPAPPTRW